MRRHGKQFVGGPTKRLQQANKGSTLQPITIDKGTQPLSPHQSISAASQGTDFVTQVCNAVPEATIVVPLKGFYNSPNMAIPYTNFSFCF
jgi:hypothetical protein